MNNKKWWQRARFSMALALGGIFLLTLILSIYYGAQIGVDGKMRTQPHDEGVISSVKEVPCDSGIDGVDGVCYETTVDHNGDTKAMTIPSQIVATGVEVKEGDQVYVGEYSENRLSFVDFKRTVPISLLALAYGLVVVLVAQMRGIRALAALAVSCGIIGWFIIPGILSPGINGLLITSLGSVFILFVTLYLAHGLSMRTSTALAGTMAGLAATVLLGMLATSAARLTGITGEESLTALSLFGDGTHLSDIITCGIVIASLGILNDVSIAQASTVWELSHVSGGRVSRREIFISAMRVGRDHIASTVYTITFVYVGSSLPVFLTLAMYPGPLGQIVSGSLFAEEIVRTLASSIGLVLTIPLTTLIASLVVTTGRINSKVESNVDISIED